MNDNYIDTNKRAWEEAYDHAPDTYKDIVGRLKQDTTTFLNPLLMQELKEESLQGTTIGQLCCNNGRELLSIGMTYQADRMIGFDLAENMVNDANRSARQLGVNATFVASDVLRISAEYDQTFDALFILIGAITWIHDLNQLFAVVSRLLKPGGTLILIDGHPVPMMFAIEGEDEFDPSNPYALKHSYFKDTPFVDTDGMYYMTKTTYESQPFTSHTHPLMNIINALITNDLIIKHFVELDEDYLDNFPELNHQGIPLTFAIKAKRTQS
jgi:ubiquinone/menaquinone biosynthesis C-methylase UbiE